MRAFYYAQTDENGVLCVDQLSSDDWPEGAKHWTHENVADLADYYPATIYFLVDNRVPELRVP